MKFILHQGYRVILGEVVGVLHGGKSPTDHLIGEQKGTFHVGDPHRKSLRDAEVFRFPRHRLTRFDQSRRATRHRSFVRVTSAHHVGIDASR